MQIILLEKIANLGALGDVVKVKEGFARNYLIPNGKAKRATAQNLAEFEKRVNARFDHADARLDAKLADLERRVTVRMLAGIAAVSALVKLL